MQEQVCKEWDNEGFGIDLILALACKICVTAVPDWESVLLLSCIQAFQEGLMAKLRMWWTLRKFKRAVVYEKHAAEAILTLKVINFLSNTQVEYVAVLIVIVGGVIFADNGVVNAFGSFTPLQATLIVSAQFAPEFIVDSVQMAIVGRKV